MRGRRIFITVILMTALISTCFTACTLTTETVSLDFSVDKYGAVPDDGMDDTEAIQKAVDAVKEGGTVYIPKGIYEVSSINIEKSNIKLTGQNEKSTIIKFTGEEKNEYIIGISGVVDVSLSGFTITASDSNKARVGIYATNSSDLLISHVTIADMQLDTEDENDFGPHGILFQGNGMFKEGVTDSEISDCTIKNIGVNSYWGAGMRLENGSSRNTILRNYLSDFGRGGILCNNYSTDLIIRDNKISGCGLWDDTDPAWPLPHDGEPLGIELIGGCIRGIIEDNVVDHWISIACDSNYCAVRRNVIHDKAGLVYSWCQLELAEASHSIFTDNDMDKGAQCGISMSTNSPEDTTIEYAYFGYNTVRNSALQALNIAGFESNICNIYFFKNAFHNTVKDHEFCEWPGAGGVGVYLRSCHHIIFDTVKFDKHERHGVRIAPTLGENDEFLEDNVDYIKFYHSSITNSGQAFTYWDNSLISDFENYSSFEFANSKAEKNKNNDVPEQKLDENKPPLAAMEIPDKAIAGHYIIFKSTSTDPDGDIDEVLWDFGAGVPSSETEPIVSYDKPGKYRVTLIAWDNQGNASKSEKTINIVNGPPQKLDENTPVPTPYPEANPFPEGVNIVEGDNVIDDLAEGWTWSGWDQYGDPLAMGGTAHGDMNAKGDYGEYEFDGTGVEYYAWKGSDGGVVEVFIDGESQGLFSLRNSSAELYNQKIFSIYDLEEGKHTIRIAAFDNNWNMVDYLVLVQ